MHFKKRTFSPSVLPAVLLLLVLSGALLLSACAGTPAAGQDDLPLLVIGSDNYPPYNYTDENGQPAGVDVSLAREACRRIGCQPVFVSIEWERKDDALQNGEVDCLWGCFSMNDREDLYLWAGPYAYSRQAVAVRQESDIYSLEDLSGRRVAVQVSSKPEELFSAGTDPRLSAISNLYCLPGMEDVTSALRKGYVDACAGHAAALAAQMKSAGIPYRLLEEPLLRSEVGVAFSLQGDAALRDRLQAALMEMADDGTTQSILAEYGLDAADAAGRYDR